jgi:Rrf2 family cysteine metabolism transcriptional repressor
MKLSTKGRYGTRAMLDLALHHGERPIQLRDIASRQQISERYLEQLALTLKAGGLLKSVRGAKGGFTLSKPPSEIRLIDIVQTLEGVICPVACIDDPESCSRVDACVTRDIWGDLGRAMTQVLESQTLQDLVARHREKEQTQKAMYYI